MGLVRGMYFERLLAAEGGFGSGAAMGAVYAGFVAEIVVADGTSGGARRSLALRTERPYGSCVIRDDPPRP